MKCLEIPNFQIIQNGKNTFRHDICGSKHAKVIEHVGEQV